MGKGAKAPTPYMPAGQAEADAGYRQLVNNASPYASALPGQVLPGLENAANAVNNNPYFDTSMAGANFAANAATQQIAPNMLQANTNLTNLGNGASDYAGAVSMAGIGAGQQALAAGQQTYDQAQALLPSTTGGAALAPNVYQQLMGMIPGTTQGGLNAADPMLIDGLIKAQQMYGTTMGAIPGLTGGMGEAQTLLNNGFDPQGQLRDREYQKTMDQQNAMNAMYGLSTSPYGAGVAGRRAQDFGLDWQDRQLGRQISALGAYGTQQGQVADNLTSLVGTASGAYNDTMKNAAMNYQGLTSNAANNAATLANSATGNYTGLTSNAANNFATLSGAGSTALNQGVDNYRQALAGAVGNYSNLVNTAGNAYSSAGQQGIDAVQTVAAGTRAPSETYLGQQDAYIKALQALAQGGTQALAPTSALTNAEGQYLQSGQNATSVAQNATSINNQKTSGILGGVGALVGTVAGIALAPATGGLSLFGLGSAAARGMSASAASGGLGAIVSDRRLKDRIVKLGKRADGISVYVFSYLGSRARHVGVMAQDVLKVKPEAVITMSNGFYAVDYGAL